MSNISTDSPDELRAEFTRLDAAYILRWHPNRLTFSWVLSELAAVLEDANPVRALNDLACRIHDAPDHNPVADAA